MRQNLQLLFLAGVAAVYSALPPGLRPIYQVLTNAAFYAQRAESLAQAALRLVGPRQRLSKDD